MAFSTGLPKRIYERLPRRLPRSLGFKRYALYFDGVDDYVEVPAMNINMPSITVLVLAKSSTPTWNTYGWLASSRDASGFIVHPVEGEKRWGGFVFDDAGTFHKIGDHEPSDITAFHQYGISYDYDTKIARMIFDGVVVVETALDITRGVWNHHTLIGKDDTADRYGKGIISEVLIYNRPLSQAEIRRNMLEYHNPVRDGLVLWLHDRIAGDIWYDESPYTNNGTIYGAVRKELAMWELRASIL